MPENIRVDETYTVARRAAWAGDVAYCLDRLNELRRRTRRASAGSPLALLRHAGEQLQARVIGREAPPKELIVETAHLRGVVWQTGRREFELLAYLIDSSWEDELYRHARAATVAKGLTILVEEEEKEDEARRGALRQGELYPHVDVERAPEIDEGLGVSWEEDIEGLLCTGTVGDLGLIKIRGVWTGGGIPQHANEVVARFRQIITRVESPEIVNPRRRE
jgi:hypothetical protein